MDNSLAELWIIIFAFRRSCLGKAPRAILVYLYGIKRIPDLLSNNDMFEFCS
jgi:hypothetical protein